MELELFLPNFRYKCEKDGLVENEICPVFVGITNRNPIINPDEVEKYKWTSWKDWLYDTKNNSGSYSEWFILEAQALLNLPRFNNFLKKL